MNAYQRKKSKEIKALMRVDKFKWLSYKQARKQWKKVKNDYSYCPCIDCIEYPYCAHYVIAFCRWRITL